MNPRELQRLKSKARRLAARLNTPDTASSNQYIDKTFEDVTAELRIHEIELELQNQELVEARNKSEKSTRDYTELFELSPVGLMLTDASGFIKKVNQQVESILHTKRARLVGETFARFAADATRDTFHLHVQNVLRHHLPQNDIISLAIGNKRKTVRLRSKPYQSSPEDSIHIFSVIEDVTGEHKAETELELAAAVFTNTSEGIMICDDSNTIVRVNNAVAQITGYSGEDVTGIPCHVFFDDYINVFSNDEGVSFDSRDYRDGREIWATDKSGQRISLHVHTNTLKHEKSQGLYHVIFLTENTEQKRYQEKLEHSASHDLLTNLPNRFLLLNKLSEAMAVCHHQQNILGLIFVDLDNFKEINDTLGHYVGDQVLKSIARRMENTIRENDFVARLGGDEFVVLFTSLHSKEQLSPLLTRLLENMKKPVSVEGENISVTFSAGVAFYPQEERILAEHLVRQADQAMYTAKQAGKSQARIFDLKDDRKLRAVYQSANKMELALKNHEFVLYFQPIVDIKDGELVGVEALIRWQQPNGAIITASKLPLRTIPTALALEVDNWVVKDVFGKLHSWQLNQGLKMKVSVNIGSEFLHQDGLVSRLSELLAQYPETEPGQLVFEIGENSVTENFDVSSAIITRLKDMGFEFALDDFGTGYSSLTYMRRLPVNTVKIDKSMIDMDLMDESQLAMLQCISQMANANHQSVIVEGTETAEQLAVMKQINCTIAQGFWISPPLSEAQLMAWISDRK